MADIDTLDLLSKLTSEGCSLGELITIASELAQAGKPQVADQAYKIWARFNPEHPQLCPTSCRPM